MKPTPAAASIMPSIPMLMMPDRSHHRPVMAPRAMGVASTSDSSNRLVTFVVDVPDSANANTRISGMAAAAARSWARPDQRSNRSGRKATAAASR